MQHTKSIHMVAFILLVAGGLNWLLVGLFNYDVVSMIFGYSLGAKIVYILVGLAAVYEVITHKKNCRMCGTTA